MKTCLEVYFWGVIISLLLSIIWTEINISRYGRKCKWTQTAFDVAALSFGWPVTIICLVIIGIISFYDYLTEMIWWLGGLLFGIFCYAFLTILDREKEDSSDAEDDEEWGNEPDSLIPWRGLLCLVLLICLCRTSLIFNSAAYFFGWLAFFFRQMFLLAASDDAHFRPDQYETSLLLIQGACWPLVVLYLAVTAVTWIIRAVVESCVFIVTAVKFLIELGFDLWRLRQEPRCPEDLCD